MYRLRLLAGDHLGILLVLGAEVGFLAEAIAGVLEVFGDAGLQRFVLGDLDGLLERSDAALEGGVELLYESHVLGVVKLGLGLLLDVESLVVEKKTLSDVTILVVGVDLGALAICRDGLVDLAELFVDVAFYIIEGGVVGLVLLGIVKQGEETVGLLAAGDIVVDEADEDGLAGRESGETLLEDVLAGLLVTELVGDLGELGIDITVIAILLVVKAFLEEGLGAVEVLACPCGETCIVQGLVVGLVGRSGHAGVVSLLEELAGLGEVAEGIGIIGLLDILLGDTLDTLYDIGGLGALVIRAIL